MYGTIYYRRPAYRPDIDGLRAVAVLAVVGFHASSRLVPGGYVGVDIFFVISGYVISSLIFKTLAQDGSFSFVDFYARRIRRLFPALIVVLLATWAFGWAALLSDEYRALGKHIAAGAGFLSNFALWHESGYFDAAAETKPLLHLWSLSIEEQFYLVWPLLAFVAWRRGLSLLAVVLVVAAASFMLAVVSVGRDPAMSFYFPAMRVWELLLGALLAHLEIHRHGWLPGRGVSSGSVWMAHALAGVGMLLLIGAVLGLDKGSAFPGWRALLPTLGALLLIAAGPRAWINRWLLGNRVLVFIGLISYPLYLWHWPLLSFGHITESLSRELKVGLLALAFLLAWGTYKFIELPVRSGKNRNWVALPLSGAVAAVAALGVATYAAQVEPRSSIYGLEKVVRAANDWSYPGPGLQPFEFEGSMLRGQGTGPGKVMFFGDSNIEQYWPRVDKLLNEQPARTKAVVFATMGGCPPIPHIRDEAHPRCDVFVERAYHFAYEPQVDTVVLGAQWNRYFSDGSPYFFADRGFTGSLRVGSEAARRAYAALESRMAELERRGKQVYLVLNIPTGKEVDPRSMVERSLLNGGFVVHRARHIDRNRFVAGIEPILSELKAIAHRTGATVIDPLDWLCRESVCPSMTEDGEPIYKDAYHIRPFYVKEHGSFLDRTVLTDVQRVSL